MILNDVKLREINYGYGYLSTDKPKRKSNRRTGKSYSIPVSRPHQAESQVGKKSEDSIVT